MRCCVPFCKKKSDEMSSESKGISFHAFPSEMGLRAAWLRALGEQDGLLPDSAVVCSQHFLDDDICATESGLRQLAAGAVPSTVQVCMICLDTDSRLFLMSRHKLDEAYEKLSGYRPCDAGNLKQALCIQCAQRLRSFSRFREKSLRARAIMMELVEKHEFITRRHIEMINRTKSQLENSFVEITPGPDSCDLHIQEQPSEVEEEQIESTVSRQSAEVTLQTVEVKKERSVDEDMAGVTDDSDAESVASDDSISTETKVLDDALSRVLKKNQRVIDNVNKFQCSLCNEEFEAEPAYERHKNVHDLIQADGCVNSGETSETNNGVTATSTAPDTCKDTLQLILQNQSVLFEITSKILETQKKIAHELASLSVKIEESTIVKNVNNLKDSLGASENSSCFINKINDVQDLEKMETLLSDEQEKCKLFNALSFFCSGGPGTAKNCAFRLIDVMFSRDFLCKCSWSGSSRSDEAKVGLKHYKKTLEFFYDVIKHWDPSHTVEENENFFKSILKNSTKRKNVKYERTSTKRQRTNKKAREKEMQRIGENEKY